ncbi:aspartate racemase family protein [Deinococcus aerius]|uniref:Aspartate racemase family protein n=1 Tax=Deinococcus aerius TaxID=200253 RepID=A0A2I9CUM1_9DEIO|nr:aspartate racemase family protein [Deinococcus aerius]
MLDPVKTLGVLGGMSWTSTAEYYRLLNEGVAERRGGLHSAPLLLHSLDFAEVARLQREDRWEEAGERLADAARGLERAGAGALLLATNTMHKVADQIEAATGIPLLHIADATGQSIRAAGLTRVGLLATAFTMEQTFYRERLGRWGVEVVVPAAAARAEVHRIIFDELCRNTVREDSRAIYRRVMEELVGEGAQGIILGCTEITLLVGPGDASVPVFDTTRLHVGAALDWLLDGGRRPLPR